MDGNATIKTEKTEEPQELHATKESKEKSKTHRRKKIRRLADEPKPTENNKRMTKCKRMLVFTGLLTFTVALLMGHYYRQNNSNSKHILKEFLKNYRNQYTQIVHANQNYCDQKQQLAQTDIFERIRSYGILNQEKILQQIEVALRNESDLNPIALVGPIGVGKSLFMRAMVENFPWQENVRTFSWETFVKNESEKIRLVRTLVDSLSDCGQNLLVIEDLWPSNHGVVSVINQLVRETISNQQKRVIVFYVFSLNTMLPRPKYDQNKDILDMLPDTNVIHLNSFGENELRDCIKKEMDAENLTLNSEDIDEIVATIEPSKSGCKNVNAKVLMFGTAAKTKDNL
ncbi:uncharacterized protein LOC142229717 [Haematobia irritans]|uniref:uncharacterized protein LOC142229717 n=1 Tax=Haematobia irritans TaxID=7368 RepID=UPI003F4F7CB6